MNRETKLSGRGFRKEWTATRPWLEYSSSSADKVFCFPCHLFACHMSTSHVKGHEAFILAGYDDWKHATEKNGLCPARNIGIHQFSDDCLSNRKKQLVDPESNPCIQASLSARCICRERTTTTEGDPRKSEVHRKTNQCYALSNASGVSSAWTSGVRRKPTSWKLP